MTARGFYTLLFGAILMITALSVSSAGAFLLGAAALIAWLLAGISVLFAFLTLRITQSVSAGGQELQVYRGDLCLYRLGVTMLSPLPIAPLSLRVALPDYMIPNIFMSVEAMPMTKNGKIDRNALMEMYQSKKKEARRG